MFKLLFILLASLQFTQVDKDLSDESKYAACKQTLVAMLPQATNQVEKAEVLWRLSRICLVMGEKETTKEGKRAVFGEGMKYAEEAIAANPKCADCYMWHSANVGRECQTHSLMDQAKAVPIMLEDLETILGKLGKTDYSAAWQALAEIYINHPFKSTDAGLNYARKAAMCIPKDEMRLITYSFLAENLYKRGWDASKRKETISSNGAKFAKSYKSVIDKYAYYDGTCGKAPWSAKELSQMSDREEAKAILNYAASLYNNSKERSSSDTAEYNKIKSLLSKWK